MVSKPLLRLHRIGMQLLRVSCTAGMACCAGVLVSACDGGHAGAATPVAVNSIAVDGSTAPAGAGGAASAVPITLPTAAGPGAASGTTALQSPLLKSNIDSAP